MIELIPQAEGALKNVGWRVLRTADPEAARAYIAELLQAGDTAVWHTSRALQTLNLAETLERHGVQVAEYGPDKPAPSRAALLNAKVGITGATAVVAETGTVILAEDDGYGRMVSNLPYTHVVVAPLCKLVNRLEDGLATAREYAQKMLGKPLPRYVSGISGPSKTGDVEFVIVPGMHGPGRVHIILLDLPPGADPELDRLCP